MKLEYSYLEFPDVFYSATSPSSAVNPKLVMLNDSLKTKLNIGIEDDELLTFLSGNKLSDKIISMNYAGHQFGSFNPQLGDGRAALLGEIVGLDNNLYDLHLKGCGVTSYSRGGDGRLYLGPAIREYLVSEALYFLNIPTTRTLSLVLTGETVMREKAYPGASIVRVAKGHIRVGTFEYFLYRHKINELQILIDYSVKRFFPDLIGQDNYKLKFFNIIAKKQLDLVCQWMGLGFIHGVMNTDNMSISAETIDFGPCAFLDNFQFKKVFSSIDYQGRYAYGNQGKVAIWNLSSLANCILATHDDPQKESVKYLELMEELEAYFDKKYLETFAHKMGIENPCGKDQKIINQILTGLEKNKKDFTLSFYELHKNIDNYPFLKNRLQEDQGLDNAIKIMKRSNPFIIPRNHLVELAIQKGLNGDFSYFKNFLKAIETPFDENSLTKEFSLPPKEDEVVERTFCGT